MEIPYSKQNKLLKERFNNSSNEDDIRNGVFNYLNQLIKAHGKAQNNGG